MIWEKSNEQQLDNIANSLKFGVVKQMKTKVITVANHCRHS